MEGSTSGLIAASPWRNVTYINVTKYSLNSERSIFVALCRKSLECAEQKPIRLFLSLQFEVEVCGQKTKLDRVQPIVGRP